MGWTADQVELELLGIAAEVDEVIRRLSTVDSRSWRSVAADRFRAERESVCLVLRRAEGGVEESAAAAAAHARAVREASVTLSLVTALGARP